METPSYTRKRNSLVSRDTLPARVPASTAYLKALKVIRRAQRGGAPASRNWASASPRSMARWQLRIPAADPYGHFVGHPFIPYIGPYTGGGTFIQEDTGQAGPVLSRVGIVYTMQPTYLRETSL